jgi:dTDP-glucose 4,6-dehydratase
MENKKIRCLCTGSAGFVAHHFIEHLLKSTTWDIIGIDKLNYASSGLDRLRDIECFEKNRDRVKIYTPDLQEPLSVGLAQEIGGVDYIVNFASESHVDRSIIDPVGFINNNVRLMLNMLEYARIVKPKKFIQFSTDECYGTAPDGISYKEGDRHNSGNPYSASKDAQESICRAYANTYGLNINITNSMNIIGERQHPEKFVPLCIKKIRDGEKIIVHADETLTKSGTRHYLHARNIAQALQFILEKTDERLDKNDASLGCWNIVGEKEIANSDLVLMIGKIMGIEPLYEMVNFHSSRPGHDLAYRLNGSKLRNAGFEYPIKFEDSLRKTIEWTLKNPKWL